MRAKRIAALVAICVVGAMVVGPASASASSVTLNNSSGPLSLGATVKGKSTNTRFYFGFNVLCGNSTFTGELINSGPEATVVLSDMDYNYCTVTVPGYGSFPAPITFDIAEPIVFTPTGDSFAMEFWLDGAAMGLHCRYIMYGGFTWTGENKPLEEGEGGKGWCPKSGQMEGNFDLEDVEGNPVEVVVTP